MLGRGERRVNCGTMTAQCIQRGPGIDTQLAVRPASIMVTRHLVWYMYLPQLNVSLSAFICKLWTTKFFWLLLLLAIQRPAVSANSKGKQLLLLALARFEKANSRICKRHTPVTAYWALVLLNCEYFTFIWSWYCWRNFQLQMNEPEENTIFIGKSVCEINSVDQNIKLWYF